MPFIIWHFFFEYQIPMLNGVKQEIICCCCKITHGPILQIRKRMNKFSNLSCAYCPKLCMWGNTHRDQIIIWNVSRVQFHLLYSNSGRWYLLLLFFQPKYRFIQSQTGFSSRNQTRTRTQTHNSDLNLERKYSRICFSLFYNNCYCMLSQYN